MGALFVQVKCVLCNNFYTKNKIPVIKILKYKEPGELKELCTFKGLLLS